MPRQDTKARLLSQKGYFYNFDRMMFINRVTKKAFSIEYVDDKPMSEIERRMKEPNADWKIYTSLPMSEGTERELKRVLQ